MALQKLKSYRACFFRVGVAGGAAKDEEGEPHSLTMMLNDTKHLTAMTASNDTTEYENGFNLGDASIVAREKNISPHNEEIYSNEPLMP